MKKHSSDDFAEIFEIDEKSLIPTELRLPVTIWIPIDHKQKYDLIQSRTKYKFGKFLQEVITKTIDKVIVDKAA